MSPLLADARAIWSAALDAVRPDQLLRNVMQPGTPLANAIANAPRLIVVGAGKAGASMSAGLETALGEHLAKVIGVVNVPDESVRPLRRIRLHAARPAGSNHPTEAGVVGANEMLSLAASATLNDIAICLISGGGSALLPAPADGITLAEKQHVTKLLHACGARIDEMNCVRKHLSRIKGGRLAQAFRGRAIFSLILSDVVGDPLDVIASGPTAADPTTFDDAMNVIERYGLSNQIPVAVRTLLETGGTETLKSQPANVHNLIVGNNQLALRRAHDQAVQLGYTVLNLGSFIEGETKQVATVIAGVVRSIQTDGQPASPPVCILIGGETTVSLSADSGKGGRNQEFVLAMLQKLGEIGMRNVAVVSGGTDGEDGPTDTAGAFADEHSFTPITERRLSIDTALDRHDAYPFFEMIGGLLKTGLTQTNVMDVRVVLVK